MRIAPLAALALLAAPAGVAAAQSDLPIRDTVLANGLHVIVIESHAVPLVTVELDVRNGSFTEPADYNGLSHLYEHMFFKANRVIPSQEAYLRRTRQLGAGWNGTTSEERVNYFLTLGADSVRPALQFMEDAIRHPLFQQEELVRERPVVTGEYDRNESTPLFHLYRGSDTLLWGRDYYPRKNVIGDREVILTATPEKMRAIQERYYVPNNTALILAGDVETARAFRMAAEIFGDWPRGPDPFATPAPDPPPLARSRAVIVEQPVSSVTLLLGWQGPSVTRDPAASYAADMLSLALNNRASPFQKRLVDSGLAFSASHTWYTQAHVGPTYVQLQTTPEKLLEAERALLEEVARLADSTYVPPEQLEAAREQVAIRALYEREQASEWAHGVGYVWAVAGLDYYRTYVLNMQRVTRGDLARYARTYLQGKPFVAAVMISPEARERIHLTAEALLPEARVP